MYNHLYSGIYRKSVEYSNATEFQVRGAITLAIM